MNRSRSLVSALMFCAVSIHLCAGQSLYKQARSNYQDSTIAFPLLNEYEKNAKGEELGNSHFLRGYIYKQYGMRTKASVSYFQALQYYDQSDIVAGSVNNELGIIFLESGSVDRALQYFQKAKNIWDDDDDYYMAIANLKIAECHFFKQNMILALEHYTKSLKHANDNYSSKERHGKLTNNDRLRVYEALTEFATFKFNQKLYHLAIKHNQDALIYASNAYDSGRVLNDIGNSLMALESNDTILHYFERAIEAKKRYGVDNLYTYYNLGRYWLMNSDTAKAINYYRTALTKSDKGYVDQDLVDTYTLLKNLLYEQGEIELYAAYSRTFDSVMIKHVSAAYDLQQQVDILELERARNMIIRQEESQRRLYQFIGWGSISLAIIISLFVYIFYYRRQLQRQADIAESLIPEGYDHLKKNIRLLKLQSKESKKDADTYKKLWKIEKNKDRKK